MNMNTFPVTFAAKTSNFFKDTNEFESDVINTVSHNLFILRRALEAAPPSDLTKDAFIPSANLSKMGKENTNLTEIGQNKDTGATEIIRTITRASGNLIGRIVVLSVDDFVSESNKKLFKTTVKYLEECKKQVTEGLASGQEIVASKDLQKQYDAIVAKVETAFVQATAKK